MTTIQLTEQQLVFLKARMSIDDLVKLIEFLHRQLSPSNTWIDVEAIGNMTKYLTNRI